MCEEEAEMMEVFLFLLCEEEAEMMEVREVFLFLPKQKILSCRDTPQRSSGNGCTAPSPDVRYAQHSRYAERWGVLPHAGSSDFPPYRPYTFWREKTIFVNLCLAQLVPVRTRPLQLLLGQSFSFFPGLGTTLSFHLQKAGPEHTQVSFLNLKCRFWLLRHLFFNMYTCILGQI